MRVNQCFDGRRPIVPPSLQRYAKEIERDLSSIDQMELSPSSPFLNEKIRGQSISILGAEQNRMHGKLSGFSSL